MPLHPACTAPIALFFLSIIAIGTQSAVNTSNGTFFIFVISASPSYLSDIFELSTVFTISEWICILLVKLFILKFCS